MLLQINEKTKEGKSLVSFLRELAKKNSYIKVLTDKEIEELEDKLLGELMKNSNTGDLLSENEKNDFLTKLKADAK